MSSNPFLGMFVKVIRYGERFWLRDVRHVVDDVYVGVANNDLMPDNLFACGDLVPFAAKEVIDMMEHPTPKLKVVGGQE